MDLKKDETKIVDDIKKERTKIQKFISRLKNPRIISAIVSLFALVLLNAHIITPIVSSSINQGVETILTLLIGFGIMSNADK